MAAVTESGVAPYRAVLEEFRRSCSCRVREFSPAEAREEGFPGRLRDAGAAAVVAIGLPAREAVSAVSGLPVLALMAPLLERWVAGGANRLGVSMAVSARRHLEALRRVYPEARRVALPFDPAWSGEYVREAALAAGPLGFELQMRELGRPEEVPRAIEPLLRGADVLWLLPDPTVLGAENLDLLLLASFQERVPIHAFALKYVGLGAVSALHPDLGGLGRQAGARLERRLAPRGGDPDPRFAYAERAELVLNQKIARKMGIPLPAAALGEAADVVR